MVVATPVVLYSAQPFFLAAMRDIKTRHLTMDVPGLTGNIRSIYCQLLDNR